MDEVFQALKSREGARLIERYLLRQFFLYLTDFSHRLLIPQNFPRELPSLDLKDLELNEPRSLELENWNRKMIQKNNQTLKDTVEAPKKRKKKLASLSMQSLRLKKPALQVDFQSLYKKADPEQETTLRYIIKHRKQLTKTACSKPEKKAPSVENQSQIRETSYQKKMLLT